MTSFTAFMIRLPQLSFMNSLLLNYYQWPFFSGLDSGLDKSFIAAPGIKEGDVLTNYGKMLANPSGWQLTDNVG